jgi:hypothetical protein
MNETKIMVDNTKGVKRTKKKIPDSEKERGKLDRNCDFYTSVANQAGQKF